MEKLAQRVMSAFAEALGLENSYFDSFIDHPISALRALHYPATKIIHITKTAASWGAHRLRIIDDIASTRGDLWSADQAW